MVEDELKQIQHACHEWLRQPGTSHGSRMTIPVCGAISRPIQLEVRALLTFDNVLITSAVDSSTGVCYSKLIGEPLEPGEFVDTPFDQLALQSTPMGEELPTPLRATQERYHDAMKRLSESPPLNAGKVGPVNFEADSWWIEKGDSQAEPQPRYLLYTAGVLLGYSLLEQTRSDGERRGRFHASENYFEYADLFGSLTETENERLEANVQEAYGIPAVGINEIRSRFEDLSAQANALKLYVESEDGDKIEATEITLEDLSRYYHDDSERWLSVVLAKP